MLRFHNFQNQNDRKFKLQDKLTRKIITSRIHISCKILSLKRNKLTNKHRINQIRLKGNFHLFRVKIRCLCNTFKITRIMKMKKTMEVVVAPVRARAQVVVVRVVRGLAVLIRRMKVTTETNNKWISQLPRFNNNTVGFKHSKTAIHTMLRSLVANRTLGMNLL